MSIIWNQAPASTWGLCCKGWTPEWRLWIFLAREIRDFLIQETVSANTQKCQLSKCTLSRLLIHLHECALFISNTQVHKRYESQKYIRKKGPCKRKIVKNNVCMSVKPWKHKLIDLTRVSNGFMCIYVHTHTWWCTHAHILCLSITQTHKRTHIHTGLTPRSIERSAGDINISVESLFPSIASFSVPEQQFPLKCPRCPRTRICMPYHTRFKFGYCRQWYLGHSCLVKEE